MQKRSENFVKIDFRDDFYSQILQRGYEYYEKGLVKNVVINKSNITAKVYGSYVYEVDVEIENGMLINASCDCPYNESGEYCKHIAALMYYLENDNKQGTYDIESLENIINKISEKDIKKYLYNILKSNNEMYEDFRQKFIDKFPKISKKEYERKIYSAISNCASDRYGFIDYRSSYKYERALGKYIEEAYDLVEKNDFDTAFTIITIILDSIPKTEIDDSNGSTGTVACESIEILESIIRKSDENDKVIKKIFDYLVNELKTKYLDNYGIELSDLLETFIEKRLYLEEIQEILLAILDNKEDEEYFYRREYYVSLICNIYNDKRKQLELLEKYSYDKNICIIYVDKLLEQNMIEKAIKILKKGLRDNKYNKELYAKKLEEIYLKYNMQEEYKDILYKIFYEYTSFEFETYLKIKKLYSKEEWNVEKIVIIEKMKKSTKTGNTLVDIYEEEKMIDDLFNIVHKMGVSYIYGYEYILLPKYNKELIKIYKKNILTTISRCSSRNEYRNLAYQINHIINMKDSNESIEEIFSNIKDSYLKRRPAMLDEFRQVIKNINKYL